MLGMGQRGGFAGRADWDKTLNSLLDLPVNELAECGLVDGAVAERRYERAHPALQLLARRHHSNPLESDRKGRRIISFDRLGRRTPHACRILAFTCGGN